MNLNANLSQRQQQRMALMPQMLRSIEILQMSTVDLCGLIEAELAQNELLEAIATPDASTEDEAQRERDEDFDPDRFRVPSDGAADAKSEWLKNVPGHAAGLRDHLLQQLALRQLPVPVRYAVETLIDALDERGLLPLDKDEVVQLVGAECAEAAVAVLRSLDPRGVGCHSAIEAMLAQVADDDPDYPQIASLLQEHLQELSRNRIPEVASALESSIDEVQRLLERIRDLDPRPGSAFRDDYAPQVRPDLAVERRADGEFHVVVDDLSLPVLRISDEYASMMRASTTARPVRSYLRDKMQSARDLIAAVEQRRETLARVGAALMARQRGFLERGRSAVRPMRMSVIADELGLHNSTVSRAISGKYVQTDHGVIALREFFDGARRTKQVGPNPDGMGRMAIRHEIGALIADEDKRRPLSDEQIVDLLRERGIEVARRTVAKHRQELGFRSSWQRRKHGS